MLRRALASSLTLVLVVALATPGAASFWCRVMGKTMDACCCAHDPDEAHDAPPGPSVARSCCERNTAAPALPPIDARTAAELAPPDLHALPPTPPAILAEARLTGTIAMRALDPRPPPPPERAQLATWLI